MQATVPIGTVAGVRIGAHWTVLAVFTLLTWLLADVVFPAEAAGYGRFAYWAAGLVTGTLLFAGLIAHELSHAVVARRSGVPVERITLWLFGGVSWLRGRPATPGDDFRIAAVGPLVSLAVAAAAGGASLGLGWIGASDLVVVMARWLGRVNLWLAAFNLIPAAPLDGGRILRAALWRGGDPFRAAATSARVGRAFAAGLMAFGIVRVASGDGGLWFVFLGWILLGMSRAEEADATLRGALQGKTVADVMTPEPAPVPGWITVDEFLDDHAVAGRGSSFAVEAWGGGPAGVVTLGRLEEVGGSERAATRVRDVAWPLERVATASPDEDIVEVLGRVAAAGTGHALVLDDDDRLVGLVTPVDVAKAVRLSGFGRPAGGRR